MTIQQTRDVSLATVPVLREADMARYLRAMGRRVVEHRGRQWEQILPGFYRPAHPLARLSGPGSAVRVIRWGGCPRRRRLVPPGPVGDFRLVSRIAMRTAPMPLSRLI